MGSERRVSFDFRFFMDRNHRRGQIPAASSWLLRPALETSQRGGVLGMLLRYLALRPSPLLVEDCDPGVLFGGQEHGYSRAPVGSVIGTRNASVSFGL